MDPHDRIRGELRGRILSGQLAPGARLPTERDLAREFGASATTINKIMAGLELEGLLDRHRGTGTYVRADLARRSLAVVTGPPDAPPGPRLRAALAKAAVDAAGRSAGGVRTYATGGTVPPSETALAHDAAAGRVRGALLVGAGMAAAAQLADLAVPAVHVASGAARGVAVGWRASVRGLVARMFERGAWPVAVQLPAGEAGEAMAAGYRDAVAAAGLEADPSHLARGGAADGPAGYAWGARLAAGRTVRGLVLAGAEPESALAAVLAAGVRVPEDVAVAVVCLAGRAPGFPRALARLEVDPVTLVHAALEMLAAGPPPESRRLAPRFIAGETL